MVKHCTAHTDCYDPKPDTFTPVTCWKCGAKHVPGKPCYNGCEQKVQPNYSEQYAIQEAIRERERLIEDIADRVMMKLSEGIERFLEKIQDGQKIIKRT